MAQSDNAVALSGLTAISGTPTQVSQKLRGSNADCVVAVTLGHGDDEIAKAFAKTVVDMAPFFVLVMRQRQAKLLSSIVETLVPSVPLPEHTLTEARMVAEARADVFRSGEWLTAAQLASIAGFSPTNPSAQPNKWKKEGQLFAVRHEGADYFPRYALDANTGYRPTKGLSKVIATFRGHKDDWGVAYWFASVNGMLGGKRPQDLLLTQPERVLAAAEDEVAGVLHG